MGIGRDWGALGGLLGALEGLRVLGELVEQAPKSVLRGQVPQIIPSGSPATLRAKATGRGRGGVNPSPGTGDLGLRSSDEGSTRPEAPRASADYDSICFKKGIMREG